jgi:uncharacterized DUF497 family protein
MLAGVSMRFVWNAVKARANRREHGVTFDEAMTVFRDPLARIHDDPEHSEEERREIIIGHSAHGRLLLVSFTEREGAIRVISARQASQHEREDYEEATGK